MLKKKKESVDVVIKMLEEHVGKPAQPVPVLLFLITVLGFTCASVMCE